MPALEAISPAAPTPSSRSAAFNSCPVRSASSHRASATSAAYDADASATCRRREKGNPAWRSSTMGTSAHCVPPPA